MLAWTGAASRYIAETGMRRCSAAGAILAMLAGTMMPEAFASAHNAAGLVTVAGFLAAFVLSKWQG